MSETPHNTHYRCTKCGCIWRQHSEGWSLADADQKPEQCCDNNPNFLYVIEPAEALYSKVSDPLSFDVDKDSGVEESDSPYCECGAVHQGIEGGGRCEACGGTI